MRCCQILQFPQLRETANTALVFKKLHLVLQMQISLLISLIYCKFVVNFIHSFFLVKKSPVSLILIHMNFLWMKNLVRNWHMNTYYKIIPVLEDSGKINWEVNFHYMHIRLTTIYRKRLLYLEKLTIGMFNIDLHI